MTKTTTSTELQNGIARCEAHLTSIGGVGARVAGRSIGTRGDEIVGTLVQGGVLPRVRTDDGREIVADLWSLRSA